MPQTLNVTDLALRSPAFFNHESIPRRHAADGENVAPALEWSGVPDGTQAFALVVHDPDAPLVGGFTHWGAYGIPGDATGLPEGGGDALAGVNSSGRAATGVRRRRPVTARTTTTSGSMRSTRISTSSRAWTGARCWSASRSTSSSRPG